MGSSGGSRKKEGSRAYEDAESGDVGERVGDGGAGERHLAEVPHHDGGDELHHELQQRDGDHRRRETPDLRRRLPPPPSVAAAPLLALLPRLERGQQQRHLGLGRVHVGWLRLLVLPSRRRGCVRTGSQAAPSQWREKEKKLPWGIERGIQSEHVGQFFLYIAKNGNVSCGYCKYKFQKFTN
jgi:hypothetical protein